MFFTALPFSYLAITTKGFVVMTSAALINQSVGARYPYTATYFFLSDKKLKSGYPIFLPVIIIAAVSFAGFFAILRFFSHEDIN